MSSTCYQLFEIQVGDEWFCCDTTTGPCEMNRVAVNLGMPTNPVQSMVYNSACYREMTACIREYISKLDKELPVVLKSVANGGTYTADLSDLIDAGSQLSRRLLHRLGTIATRHDKSLAIVRVNIRIQ